MLKHNNYLFIYTTSVLKYMTLLTFFIRLIICLFCEYFYKLIKLQVKSKVQLKINKMIYILL
jgi:hypothetical protein